MEDNGLSANTWGIKKKKTQIESCSLPLQHISKGETFTFSNILRLWFAEWVFVDKLASSIQLWASDQNKHKDIFGPLQLISPSNSQTPVTSWWLHIFP